MTLGARFRGKFSARGGNKSEDIESGIASVMALVQNPRKGFTIQCFYFSVLSGISLAFERYSCKFLFM